MVTPGKLSETLNDERGFDVVVIAASFGGVQALRRLLALLPRDFALPIVIVQHRTVRPPNLLDRVLAHKSKMRVKNIVPGEQLVPGTVYIAPPDLHAIITGGRRLALTDGRRIRHVLSSANPLFASAAQNFGPGVIAVVLSGNDADAAEGARAVKDAGGIVLVQDEASCESFEMPRAAIATGAVDAVLSLEEMAIVLTRLATNDHNNDNQPVLEEK